MQSHYVVFRNHNLVPLFSSLLLLPEKKVPRAPRISFCSNGSIRSRSSDKRKINKKENIWSVDNDLAKAEMERMKKRERRFKKRYTRKNNNSRIIVSASMLMEIETILQTQEPVIIPDWNTFASSISGIWKGVGAVFSPFTAKMEPIDLGNQNENLYDCYTLSRIEKLPEDLGSKIQRKVDWVSFNAFGEMRQRKKRDDKTKDLASHNVDHISGNMDRQLPTFHSFDYEKSNILEEDLMGMEPGLVFFEDGSYSRGPLDIPVGECDESKYYLSPTFKFEQCLVKGCHKRLRIVHCIEFNNGGADIQITRVAVYEEQWISPSHLYDKRDTEFDLKPFSQRKRSEPSELTGSWKVFEVSATPIFGEEETTENGRLPYVYLCTETLKKRKLPETSLHFGEEEVLDMSEVSVLWLPGGVTGYVDVKEDGILCIGVGWYSEEGINLVMERDYGTDGKLKEVRWKSELKRLWTHSVTA